MVLLAALTGCGSAQGSEAGVAAADVWARVPPAMAEAGAVYMVLTNESGQDDRLIGASVDTSVAETVELHETTTETGGASEGEMAMGEGMLGMREVEAIDVPSGASVNLEPGGLHVMLVGLAAPLEEGDTVPLTLEFERAGQQTVEAEVRSSG